MAEELAEVFGKFKLSTKEHRGLKLDNEADLSMNMCKNSIIGKVIGDKVVNFVGVKNFTNLRRGFPKNMEVIELGVNIFQFTFGNRKDMDRILNSEAWIIDNQLLVVKEWFPGIEENKECFNKVGFWVQVWNLPLHWLNTRVGMKIGEVLGKAKEATIPSFGENEGRHLKFFCDRYIPTINERFGGEMEGVSKWIEFKYERCPNFCFKCGIIGHNEKDCFQVTKGMTIRISPQFGNWLKASSIKSSVKKTDHIEEPRKLEKDKGREIQGNPSTQDYSSSIQRNENPKKVEDYGESGEK
ncbi:hypothetical protein ACH5RR_000277 [Cinchona calisaya]|uniref:CCHC-type domain-containing protein n=1 Tax=Cinchona calisaya TaxID=153742 RepID=A0ABD3B0E5_9GENT